MPVINILCVVAAGKFNRGAFNSHLLTTDDHNCHLPGFIHNLTCRGSILR